MSVSIPAKMNVTIMKGTALLSITGFFMVWAPHADVGFITGIWASMLATLALQANLKIDKATALKIASGIAIGIGGLAGGVKIAETWLAYTGVGTFPAMLLNAGTNGVMTYIVGRAAARVFVATDTGQTIDELIREILALILHPR